MELENIVANTVLLKAREGEDGDGGLTAPLSRYRSLPKAREGRRVVVVGVGLPRSHG